MNDKIAAAIVTYKPDDGFRERIATIARQVDLVVVVDNGSVSRLPLPREPDATCARILVERNRTNEGVAKALNQALRIIRQQGYAWAITLDQDTETSPTLAQSLLAAANREQRADTLALIGPDIRERGLGRKRLRWRFFGGSILPWPTRHSCRADALENVMLITSGCLTNLDVWHRLGGFEERLFIDYVDTEYCLRAWSRGYRTMVDCSDHITHSVGAKRPHPWFGITLYPTHHSALRRYYMCRNRIFMLRRYGWRFPKWLVYEIAASAYLALTIVVCEAQKKAKLKACLSGTWDGFAGRYGKSQRQFQTD